MRVVHLPYYGNNLYQALLMEAQRKAGWECLEGGGGGNFLRSALLRWRAQVLHFHWLHPYLLRRSRVGTLLRGGRLLAELSLLRRAGIRLAWTVHNLHNHEGAHLQIERRVSRGVARRMDAVICHTEHTRSLAMKHFGLSQQQTVVIPHGNYIGAYPSGMAPADARQHLGLPPAALVFGFLGRVAPYKGVGELIQSFQQIPHNQARLLIAGKPVDEAAAQSVRCMASADPRILLRLEFVPDQQLQTMFNAMDIAVLPFRDILTSGSMILAMSFGLPCIAPRLGAITETLAADGGWLYDAEAPGGLLEAMRHALAHHDRLPVMGRHNLQRAQRWNWNAIAQQTLCAYGQFSPHCESPPPSLG